MPQNTPVCEEAMLNALAKCHTETKPNLSAISREFNVPYYTLYGRFKGAGSKLPPSNQIGH
jgi:hypothetical protein